MKLEDVESPQELLDYMDSHFEYGYLGIDKLHRLDDPDFDSEWYDKYVLSNYNDVVKNNLGNCYDMTEFERTWFEDHDYEVTTIYEIVALDYENDYETHSYLIYKDGGKYYYFEFSDFDHRGIHKYDDMASIIKDNYSRYLNNLMKKGITEEEIDNIRIFSFEKPKEHIDAHDYIKHVTNGKRLY